jgi:hypothetical protein
VTVTPEPEGPAGYSYGAVLVRAEDADRVAGRLRAIGFSGWVAPPEDGWLVVLPAAADVAVARDRRDVVGVGEALATASSRVLAIRVLLDRQLVLVAWRDGGEVARYVSDPSREPGAPFDTLDEPLGVEDADAIAAVCDRDEVAEDLGELLAEELDPEEEIESERLSKVLALLGLPTWIVSAWVLPKRMPLGPSPKDLTRYGAGRTGPGGLVAGRAARSLRRRKPDPVVADPPRRQGPGPDDLMWL